MSRIDRLETIFFDLDGCIWFGSELAPNADRLVERLRADGRRVAFVSNVTSVTAALVAERLTDLGIPAADTDVMTPFTILLNHPLLEANPAVFLLGNAVMHKALRDAGLRLTDDPAAAEVVVVSRDTGLTYGQLAEASQALYGGAALLALNLDARVPVEDGVYLPGNGAIVAALTTATGTTPQAIGKPSEFYFEQALKRFNAARDTTAMVGDNLDTDIAGGQAAGLLTVQVGTDDFSLMADPPVADYRAVDLYALEELLLVPVLTESSHAGQSG